MSEKQWDQAFDKANKMIKRTGSYAAFHHVMLILTIERVNS